MTEYASPCCCLEPVCTGPANQISYLQCCDEVERYLKLKVDITAEERWSLDFERTGPCLGPPYCTNDRTSTSGYQRMRVRGEFIWDLWECLIYFEGEGFHTAIEQCQYDDSCGHESSPCTAERRYECVGTPSIAANMTAIRVPCDLAWCDHPCLGYDEPVNPDDCIIHAHITGASETSCQWSHSTSCDGYDGDPYGEGGIILNPIVIDRQVWFHLRREQGGTCEVDGQRLGTSGRGFWTPSRVFGAGAIEFQNPCALPQTADYNYSGSSNNDSSQCNNSWDQNAEYFEDAQFAISLVNEL